MTCMGGSIQNNKRAGKLDTHEHRATFLLYCVLREEIINYSTNPVIISVVVRLREWLVDKYPVFYVPYRFKEFGLRQNKSRGITKCSFNF